MSLINFLYMKKNNFLTDMVNSRKFLLLTRQYAKLLQRGEVEYLVKNGKFRFVIAHPELIPVGALRMNCIEAYAPYMKFITEKMLRIYLRMNPRRFEFFLLHPLGLRALAKEGFSGVICNHEKEFAEIGRNFPPSFRLHSKSYHNYIDLLNMQLELGLPYKDDNPEKEEE